MCKWKLFTSHNPFSNPRRSLTIFSDNPGRGRGGGGYFLVKGQWGCAAGWAGSHFHNWIDYNGVTILEELLEWGRTFSAFGRFAAKSNY